MASAKGKAPTLWGIVGFKALKGVFFLSVALGIYALVDNNLPADFKQLLRTFHFDPEKEFWANLAKWLATVTPRKVLWLASGTGLYSAISLAEAIGLGMRQSWAAWLAIAEGVFFIPIEIFDLGRHFTVGVTCILAINIVIVVYLYRNRSRLFAHWAAGGGGGAGDKPARKPKKD